MSTSTNSSNGVFSVTPEIQTEQVNLTPQANDFSTAFEVQVEPINIGSV